ncbi:cystatin isoform X2 [Nelusetta ayraudi]|uniref:cystatin isoform X2 n=1 Tax=Nelusetta ayraudi TaxID=303726 RepID=UPI003F6F0E7F
MMAVKTLLLLQLLLPLGLLSASGKHNDHLMPGAPCNISTNDGSLRPVVLDATNFYNNQSNDAFLFRPSAVLAAQRQLVKGFKYMVDLELSRTVCPKGAAVNLTSCDFQPAGRLHQVLRCHFMLWLIPWTHTVQDRVLTCT